MYNPCRPNKTPFMFKYIFVLRRKCALLVAFKTQDQKRVAMKGYLPTQQSVLQPVFTEKNYTAFTLNEIFISEYLSRAQMNIRVIKKRVNC
jgi:hypothetical protein